MKKVVLIGFIFLTYRLHAQNIAINTTGADPDGSAMLDIDGANHGLLVPRVALTATNAAGPVTSPAVSLLVYNTATVSDVTPGYYYWNGTAWVRFFDATVNSADHDWYAVGGTDAPNSINDNIFTQGSVGIGTTSPGVKLDVNGGARINQGLHLNGSAVNSGRTSLIFGNTSGETYSLSAGMPNSSESGVSLNLLTGYTSGASIQFISTNLFRILSNGNVGIGTIAPSQKLDVTSGNIELNQNYGIGVNIGSATAEYIIQLARTGIQSLPGLGSGAAYDNSLSIESDQQISFIETDAEKLVGYMNVNDNEFIWDGKIGIGTTAPTSKLHALANTGGQTVGQIRVTGNGGIGTGDAYISFEEGSEVHNWSVGHLDGHNAFAISSDLSLGSDVRFLINENGYVGIGTTTPSGKFHVQNDNSGSDSSFVIKESGNVGVGTLSPGAKLHVIDTYTGGLSSSNKFKGICIQGSSNDMLGLAIYDRDEDESTIDDGDAMIYWGDNSDDDLRFVNHIASTITDQMIIKGATGNVGIGTTSPQNILHIKRTSSEPWIWLEGNGATNSRVYLSESGDSGAFLEYDPLNDRAYLSHRLLSVDNTSPNITFTRSGNVGIGTAAPVNKLHIEENSAFAQIRMGADLGSDKDLVIHYGGNGVIPIDNELRFGRYADNGGGWEANPVVFDMNAPNGSIYLDSIGYVGIGTTSPTEKLHVSSETDGDAKIVIEADTDDSNENDNPLIEFKQDGGLFESAVGHGISSVNANVFAISNGVSSAGGIDFMTGSINGYTNSSSRMFITSSGDVGIGITSPTEKLHVVGNILASGTITSSDQRYKKDIKGIENATAIIEKLRPVSYLFRTKEFEGQFDDNRHYGLLAQEIEKVLPELVYTDNKGYKAVNYTDLISVLLKGLQEQQDKFVDQEQKFSLKLKSQEEKFTKQIEELKSLIISGSK